MNIDYTNQMVDSQKYVIFNINDYMRDPEELEELNRIEEEQEYLRSFPRNFFKD